jgi:hypothetical protein
LEVESRNGRTEKKGHLVMDEWTVPEPSSELDQRQAVLTMATAMRDVAEDDLERDLQDMTPHQLRAFSRAAEALEVAVSRLVPVDDKLDPATPRGRK